MADDWVVAVALTAVIVPIAVFVDGLRRRAEASRRRAWRQAAEGAGIVPALGPWVVAEVAGTWIEAGDHEIRSARSEVTWRSGIRALVLAPLPDGLVISTSESHPGIVRRRLPCGDKHVIVRGLDEAEVSAFLADGRAAALTTFFAAVPDAVIESNLVDFFAGNRMFLGSVSPPIEWERVTGAVRVWHGGRIDAQAIQRELSAFVELIEALHLGRDIYR